MSKKNQLLSNVLQGLKEDGSSFFFRRTKLDPVKLKSNVIKGGVGCVLAGIFMAIIAISGETVTAGSVAGGFLSGVQLGAFFYVLVFIVLWLKGKFALTDSAEKAPVKG